MSQALAANPSDLPQQEETFPWGTTASSALRWAYNQSLRSSITPGVLAKMAAVHRQPRDPHSLTQVERGAQAALICQEVDRLLDPLAKSLLIAYYLPRPAVERLAGGETHYVDRFANERAPAIQAVAHALMGMEIGAGQRHLRGYIEVVTQYVLGLSNNDRLAAQMKLRRERASDTRAVLYAKLADIRDRGLALAGERLYHAGLLP